MILSKKVKRASKTVVIPWFNTCKNFSTNGAVLKPALGDRSIFKSTSTPQLIKKSLVYRMSKSEFVLKHGSNLIRMSYKYLGKETTNSLIEKTAGEVFTSGPNIKTLIVDIDKFYNERGIYSGANYVLEGCEKDDIPTFNRCRDYLIETLDRVCKTRPYAHLAIKLSGLAQMEMFKRYHKAQHTLMHNLFLQYSIKSNEGRRVLSKEGLERFCKDNNYNITDSNINEFIEIAKFKNSKFGKNEISDVEFFANVHAHYFNSDKHNSNLIKQICEKSEITAETREEILRFEKRFEAIVSRASEYQTILFVDAEQTYIQGALDGITRQLQSIYHKNQHAFILNGCQSYLKSSPHYVRLELERCREEGISCGIKLVRGAYMEEERKVAAENNVPSPVWDKIEDTHSAYNGNLQFLLNNMNPDRDFVLIGSHNADSCNLAKPIIKGRNLTNKSYCFGQLKGFSDSLSFSLAEKGFNILKYLPYGPTEFLIPYLMRRGQESKQVMREHLFLDEISHELNKRMFRR